MADVFGAIYTQPVPEIISQSSDPALAQIGRAAVEITKYIMDETREAFQIAASQTESVLASIQTQLDRDDLSPEERASLNVMQTNISMQSSAVAKDHSEENRTNIGAVAHTVIALAAIGGALCGIKWYWDNIL